MDIPFIVDKTNDDGTLDVHFTHSDGRILYLYGTVTPEMDEDEFNWAYDECEAGNGGDYGYAIDGYSLPA